MDRPVDDVMIAEPSPAPDEAPRELSAARQWYMVVALALLMMVASVDRNAISLIADAVKADLNLSDTQLGWLVGGSFVVFSSLLMIPAGWAVDVINRRNLIGVGALLWSLATVCSGLAHSFLQLFGGRAGVGFSEGVLNPAAFSMIRDGVSPDRRGRAFAINGLGAFLGSALALVLSSAILKMAESHGPFHLPVIGLVEPWQMVFFAIGLGGFPFVALVGLIVEPARRLERGETASGPVDRSLSKALLSYGDALAFMYSRRGQYGPLIATAIMFGMMVTAFVFLTPSMVHRNYGIPLTKVGLLLAPVVLIMPGMGNLTSGVIIDMLTKRGVSTAPAMVVLVGLAVMAVPIVAGPLMPSVTGFLVMFAVVVFTGGALSPGVSVMNSRITPSLNAGKIFVLFNFGQGVIGASAGTLLAGFLSDQVFHGTSALAHGVSLTGAIFIAPTLFTAWRMLRTLSSATAD